MALMLKRRCITGDESEVHGRWRHSYRKNVRPGITAAVKRRSRRRERREGKAALRDDL